MAEKIKKLNCWEVLKCERQPGGSKVNEFGVCPAAVDHRYDGLNGGKNAGRICWAVTGTFCDGTIQGTFAEKQLTCLACDFFAQVRAEEGSENFFLDPPPPIFLNPK